MINAIKKLIVGDYSSSVFKCHYICYLMFCCSFSHNVFTCQLKEVCSLEWRKQIEVIIGYRWLHICLNFATCKTWATHS